MKQRPLILIFAGCISGMAAVWKNEIPSAVFYCLILICFWGLCCVVRDKRYVLGILGMFLGILLLTAKQFSVKKEIQVMEADSPEYIIGEVIRISETENSTAYLLKQQNQEGKVLLYSTGEEKIRLGDWVQTETKLEVQDEARNPGQFSARDYYFAKGIYYRAFANEILVIGHQEHPLMELQESSRQWMKEQIHRQYEGDVLAFVQGMILGDKSELSEEIKDDFKESGLIHLLAVSGLHISLAGKSLYRWLRKIGIGFFPSSAVGLAAGSYYCMLTGGAVSSIRAIIMLGIYFLSQILGKNYDLLSSAAMAGILTILKNPLVFGDTGFRLSFCAVLVIGVIGRGKKGKTKMIQKIWDKVRFPLLLQVGMLPLMIYIQYETPIFSFFANAIAVPAASAAFSMALALIWLPAGFFHKIIACFFQVVLWISEQDYGRMIVGHVPGIWVIIGYFVLYLCMAKRSRIPIHIRVGVVYAGILLMMGIPVFRRNELAFLDVGQGDCMIADTAGGMVMVDGGSSSEKHVGRYRILPYLKYCGRKEVKIAVITHMDEDHYSGILELLEMGKVRYLGLPDVPRDETFQKILQAAHRSETQVFFLSREKKIDGQDISLEVMHPSKGSSLEKNAASLVLQGKLLGKKIILTGDVEKEGEEELLDQSLEETDILKVAHHGSKNSTSEDFLRITKPKIAIISCGKANRYGHPHKEVLERLKAGGSQIRRTDEEGALIFSEEQD